TKLRVIDVPRIPDPAYTLQYIVGAWRDGDGTNKMVVYQQLDTGAIEREEAFFLYSFRIEGDKVTYTPLDTTEIKVFKDKVTPYYFYESSFVWHSRDNKEHTLVAAYGQTDIYSIVTNTLQFRWTKRRREGSGHYLLGNTTDTISNGFVRGANPHLLLYSSNPVKDTNAHAKIPIFYKGQPYESVHAIGDINNDGFGDIAVVYGTEDFLTLYLGRSSVLSTVIDDTRTNITLNNNQPCSKSGVLTVRVSSVEEREIRLSLYSLNGAIAADMGTYPTSGGIVAIPLARYALSPGMYNLRCTIGTQVFDKGLIITE
ncbi:MAG: hypothetical protein JNL32_12355, partial [Candidatus Kapabacteria bacterium]|nr:hypothetical protein [Candidatus Kapabacteria bacterium]